jgi:hypothetical protein
LLFETLDMPQKPDALRVVDEHGDEVFVWSREGHRIQKCACRRSGMLFAWTEPNRRRALANVHYRIVEHEGGWAYKVGDV